MLLHFSICVVIIIYLLWKIIMFISEQLFLRWQWNNVFRFLIILILNRISCFHVTSEPIFYYLPLLQLISTYRYNKTIS